MKKLLNGIIDFRKNCLGTYRDKFSGLALKQSPDTLFIACCDSRVVPNVFASSDPGDLFVLRNIGNLVPPYYCETQCGCQTDLSVLATIEFSLLSLEVKDIVICGHSDCGAMQTLMENGANKGCSSKSLNLWLEYAALSYKRFQSSATEHTCLTPCNCLSRINVLQQMDNLKTYPLVMERVRSNRLKIHGWWFDLATADVYHYDEQKEAFVLIDQAEAKSMLVGVR